MLTTSCTCASQHHDITFTLLPRLFYAGTNATPTGYAPAAVLWIVVCAEPARLPKAGAVISYKFTITNGANAFDAATHRLAVTLTGPAPDESNLDHVVECRHDSSNNANNQVQLFPSNDSGQNLLGANEIVTCTFSISANQETDGLLPEVTVHAQLLDASNQTANLDSSITFTSVHVYSGSTLQLESNPPTITGGIQSEQLVLHTSKHPASMLYSACICDNALLAGSNKLSAGSPLVSRGTP